MGEVQLREGLLYGRRLQYSEGLLYGACCWSTDGYPGTVRVSIMELAAGVWGGDGWMGEWVHLEALWGHLEVTLEHFGFTWVHFGVTRGHFGALWGHSGVTWG